MQDVRSWLATEKLECSSNRYVSKQNDIFIFDAREDCVRALAENSSTCGGINVLFLLFLQSSFTRSLNSNWTAG